MYLSTPSRNIVKAPSTSAQWFVYPPCVSGVEKQGGQGKLEHPHFQPRCLLNSCIDYKEFHTYTNVLAAVTLDLAVDRVLKSITHTMIVAHTLTLQHIDAHRRRRRFVHKPHLLFTRSIFMNINEHLHFCTPVSAPAHVQLILNSCTWYTEIFDMVLFNILIVQVMGVGQYYQQKFATN